MTGYTYDIRIYLGKERQNAVQVMKPTYSTVKA